MFERAPAFGTPRSLAVEARNGPAAAFLHAQECLRSADPTLSKRRASRGRDLDSKSPMGCAFYPLD